MEVSKILQEHVPVLLKDFISLSAPIKGCWIDGTFGAGGYSRALLQNGACQVLAIDKDSTTKTFFKIDFSSKYFPMFIFFALISNHILFRDNLEYLFKFI